jgi:hypothetical protein
LKHLALILPLISLNCLAVESNHDTKYSIGLGLGAMYSGIGTNLSFVSEHDLKYISAGCVEYSSINGATCGFGTGWIKSDLFGANSNKHGFGVYVSLVGNESYTTANIDGATITHYSDRPAITEDIYNYNKTDNDIYGAGLSYTYFVNGINKSGTTFGISLHATNADRKDSFGGFFQVGYQF